ALVPFSGAVLADRGAPADEGRFGRFGVEAVGHGPELGEDRPAGRLGRVGGEHRPYRQPGCRLRHLGRMPAALADEPGRPGPPALPRQPAARWLGPGLPGLRNVAERPARRPSTAVASSRPATPASAYRHSAVISQPLPFPPKYTIPRTRSTPRPGGSQLC